VATFEVSKFNTAALTSSVPPLCVTNSPFNLSNIVQSTATGIWNGTSVQSSGGSYFFDPSTLATGNYVLTYSTFSTPNPNACPDMSNIGVAVTKTTVPAMTPVAPFCTNKNAFHLTATP